jgi:hypothetical protein
VRLVRSDRSIRFGDSVRLLHFVYICDVKVFSSEYERGVVVVVSVLITRLI